MKPLLFRGQMMYPLKDPVNTKTALDSCKMCAIFRESDEYEGSLCQAFVDHPPPNNVECQCIHWGVGEAAQLQYVKERLTS